jgi:hypothetical protein
MDIDTDPDNPASSPASLSSDPICLWLTEQIALTRSGSKPTWISVSLVQSETTHQELSRWKLNGQANEHIEASSLTAAIRRIAAGSTQFHASFCRFAVFAWWPNKSCELYLFTLNPQQFDRKMLAHPLDYDQAMQDKCVRMAVRRELKRENLLASKLENRLTAAMLTDNGDSYHAALIRVIMRLLGYEPPEMPK